MGTEYLLGPMVVNIQASTSMIKRKDMVFSSGPMVVNMMVLGFWENNMELEYILIQRV